MQTCDHIVHVDPLSPSSSNLLVSRDSFQRRISKQSVRLNDVIEIYASTKPYPVWWNDAGQTKGAARRKSMGDDVLERNLCFADILENGLRKESDQESLAIEYIEDQLKRIATMDMPEEELLSVVCGRGGPHVDLVLYMLGHGEDMVRKVQKEALLTLLQIYYHATRCSYDEFRPLQMLYL